MIYTKENYSFFLSHCPKPSIFSKSTENRNLPMDVLHRTIHPHVANYYAWQKIVRVSSWDPAVLVEYTSIDCSRVANTQHPLYPTESNYRIKCTDSMNYL